MYIRIYKENGQWFNYDTEVPIGNDIPLIIGNLVDYNGKNLIPAYGYLDMEGSFHSLCDRTNCSFSCLSEQHKNCRYISKGIKDNHGFYIDIPE